jgi:hypothetical protein
VRLLIVDSRAWGSVVARMNTTWAGGSSRLFSSAFDAPRLSMWTSSRMTTLRLPEVPRGMRSMSSRMSATPLLEAASSSTSQSTMRPWSTASQFGQVPQGSPALGASQLRTLARMRAVDVFPVPRGPLNR